MREATSSLSAPHVLPRSSFFLAPLITLLCISQQNAFKTYSFKTTVRLEPEGNPLPPHPFDIPLILIRYLDVLVDQGALAEVV